MSERNLPEAFRRLLEAVDAKRPRTVIQHLLKHGQITTEDLQTRYGYNHPPRAIRDVRELGIPIDTFRVTGSDGRSIAAYRFGDPKQVRAALMGRTAFAAGLKNELLENPGTRCNIYLEEFPAQELQIDHRIPFEIAGDHPASADPDRYLLLCASANRAKSWSCEHCTNWKQKDPKICKSCYWAYPEEYTHVAMREIRRLDILWRDDEISDYENLRKVSSIARQEIPEYVKSVLRKIFSGKES